MPTHKCFNETTNLPHEVQLSRVSGLVGNLLIRKLCFDSVDSIRNIVYQEVQVEFARRKVVDGNHSHTVHMAVEVGKDVVSDGGVGGGCRHELQESWAEVFDVLGIMVGSKFWGIAIAVEEMLDFLSGLARAGHDDLFRVDVIARAE
jgi:hypothetical protein